jgi:hypothetical protein
VAAAPAARRHLCFSSAIVIPFGLPIHIAIQYVRTHTRQRKEIAMKKGLILCGMLGLGLATYGCHKDHQDMDNSHGSMDMHDNGPATQPTSSADPAEVMPTEPSSNNTSAPQSDSQSADGADASKPTEQSEAPSQSSEANADKSATETPTATDNTQQETKSEDSTAATDQQR